MDRQRIIDNGWRQGVCIYVRDFPEPQRQELIGKGMYGDDLMIVVNQSCDVVCEHIENEPLIEMIRATPCTTEDGNLLNAKNPRSLLLEAPTFIAEPYLLFRMNDRAALGRAFIEGHNIGEAKYLDGDGLHILKTWLGARYTRASFPDEFCRRVEIGLIKMQKRLGKMVAGEYVSKYVEGIYMRVEPDEEVAGTASYDLYCFALISQNTPQAVEDKIIEAMSDLVHNIDTASVQIQTEDSLVRLTTEVTIDELMGYKRYYFDFISIKHGEDPGPTV